MTSVTKTAADNLAQFLSEMQGRKSAEAGSEPGSIDGATSHPSKEVEDGTRPATEGEQSAFNTAQVKEDHGEPSVDSTSEADAGKADVKKKTTAIHAPAPAPLKDEDAGDFDDADDDEGDDEDESEDEDDDFDDH